MLYDKVYRGRLTFFPLIDLQKYFLLNSPTEAKIERNPLISITVKKRALSLNDFVPLKYTYFSFCQNIIVTIYYGYSDFYRE